MGPRRGRTPPHPSLLCTRLVARLRDACEASVRSHRDEHERGRRTPTNGTADAPATLSPRSPTRCRQRGGSEAPSSNEGRKSGYHEDNAGGKGEGASGDGGEGGSGATTTAAMTPVATCTGSCGRDADTKLAVGASHGLGHERRGGRHEAATEVDAAVAAGGHRLRRRQGW